MTIRVELAFNPDSISSSKELMATLSDLSTEAGSEKPHKRINPYTIEVTTRQSVVCKKLNKHTDVREYCLTDSKLRRLETRAALRIRNALVSEDVDTIAVWFSPPSDEYEYSEGRITAGVVTRDQDGTKKLVSYGIVTDNMTSDEMFSIALQLNEFSKSKLSPSTNDGLRSIPIIFKLPESEDNPWEFLKKYIPLPEIWENIISGKADEQKEETNAIAQRVAEETFHVIKNAKTSRERIQAVRAAQDSMEKFGKPIVMSRICSTHTETIFTQTHHLMGINSTPIITITMDKWTYHPGNCVHCGEKDTMVGPCEICKICEKLPELN